MTMRTRTFLLAVGLAGTALGAGVFATSALRAQEDQGVLAGLISNLLSTPTQQISIGAVEGALSSEATIRDIRISDEEGVWLSLDRATIDWSRSALIFQRRLEVTELTLGTLTVERPPAPGENVDAQDVEDGPLFPELPLEVVVDRFALEELVLGEPVLGTAARLSAEGSTRIGNPEQGITLAFAAERLDAPGSFGADVAYLPVANTLALDVTLDEPAGGLVARLADLPGLPPVRLSLQGEGPLEDFAANLDFEAGPTIGADGRATVRRVDGAYALDLDLAARIAGLLPEAVAPIFEGTTRLSGDVTVGDGGRIALDGVRLASPVAELTVGGAIGPEGLLDLAVAGRALPTQGGVTEAGRARIGELALDVSVNGSLQAPRIDGEIVARDVATPVVSLDSLDLTVDSAPVGTDDPPTRFSFGLDADAQGLTFADPALQDAIGSSLSVVARGEVSAEGVADVETAAIETRTASATFAGRVGASVLDGTLDAAIADLAAFSRLAGLDLSGSADVEARVVGDPSAELITAQLAGTLDGFESGIAAIDGLVGDTATLSGTVQRIPGGFGLTNLMLDGANLMLVADGRATDEDADLTLDVTIPTLAPLDERVDAGRATARARLTGSLATPDVAATVSLRDVVAMERPIERLDLRLAAQDVTGDLDADVALSGSVAGEAAEGTARVRRTDGGGLALEALDLTIGSVVLAGDLAVGDAGLAAGAIRLDAGDLSDLAPLLLTELGGSLEADVSLAVEDGGQNADIMAEGSSLRVGDVALSDVFVDVRGRDLFRTPVLNGAVRAQRLVVGGQTFERVDLAFDGTPQETAFTASATAQGFDLSAEGRIVPQGEAITIALSDFRATRDGRSVALAEEASVTIADRAVAIDGVLLRADGGIVAVDGTVGETLDLEARIADLPLSVAEIFVPDLGIAGVANGTIDVSGTTSAPEGTYDLSVSGFSVPQLRAARLPGVDLDARGTFTGERATVDATLAVGGGRLAVSGSVPLDPSGEIDLDVTARSVPLALARAVAPDLDVSGTLSGAADLGGTLAAPTGTYDLDIDALSLAQARDAGIAAIDIGASGRLTGERATIDASVSAPPLGTLSVDGSVPLDPSGRIDLAVTGPVTLDPLSRFLDPGQRVGGQAQVDLDVGGTFSDPQVTGGATLSGGTFRDDLRGIALTGIAGRVAAEGDSVRIADLTAQTPNGGSLSVGGSVGLRAGYPADLTITGRDAQLLSSDLLTAVADLDLDITGPLATTPTIAGSVDLATLDVTIPDTLPTTLEPLPGTEHVDPPPQAAARLALARERAAREAGAGGVPFDARLDLTVIAQNQIFVRGRGVDAELGGRLRLTGTTSDPDAVGAFDLRRGRLDILGRRLDFTRGRLTFAGSLIPSLDLVAQTLADGITAQIAVRGPATAPRFELSSTPDLPDDEILSRILFGRAAGGLSAGQALQLAQGVASLAGGGAGVFEEIRKSLGVDSLDISAGEGGPTVGIGRYIADNVRLGIRAGARPDDTGVSLDIDLTDRLRFQGAVGADGRSSVGVGYEIEY
ncbi:translocation/assembly module TamB domain-containing protein [Salinarimonas chemoclinalis]|uniref:translocation/assembly module TamB domain-containing protein n=1 Tax=Salinarimonas chemoclinalis TaxID=3241599 RepID=UPI003556BF88